MSVSFKQIVENDYSFIADVYNYYILNSTATFHTELLDESYFRKNLPLNHPKYKAYIIYNKDIKVGYCYFSPYINRPAYMRTAEISVYINHNFIGKGVGSKTISFLIEKARELEFSNLLGLICAENTESINLFLKNNFIKVADLKNVGEKFNRILNVHIYQLEL